MDQQKKPEKVSGDAQKTEGWQETLVSVLHDFGVMVVVILLLFLTVFRLAQVDGSSMYPTLVNGDYVLMLSNLVKPVHKPGEVVVVHETSFEDDYVLIKRVIATEGQTVDIDFDAGIVYVDGIAQEEPYTNTPTNLYEGVDFPQTVPEGCVFVMGDNRNNSKDSRDPSVGMVDQREIFGKAIFTLMPGMDVNTGKRDYSRIGAVK